MEHRSTTHLVLTSITLGTMILATIVGNVFVIAAILLEKHLRHIGNYLIASLAVADLLVATLVMPLALVKEVSTRWFLGPIVCDVWISFDVLCCTSSILHLVAISLDRYWAVNRVEYIHNRSAKRIGALIAISWGLSAVISIPPLFSDNRMEARRGNHSEMNDCMISQNWGYTVFSTVGAFYIPLLFMIIIYISIYRTARMRIRKKQFIKSMRSRRGMAGNRGGAAGITSSTPLRDKRGYEHPHISIDDSLNLDESVTEFKETDRDENGGIVGGKECVSETKQIGNGHNRSESSASLQEGGSKWRHIGAEPSSPQNSRGSLPNQRTSTSTSRPIDLEVAAAGSTIPADSTLPTPSPTSQNGLNNTYSEEAALTSNNLGSHLMTSESTLAVCGSRGTLATPSSARGSWLDLSKFHWDQKDQKPSKPPELKAKEKIEKKRERKAARTLAIITGSFISCWLPFFIIALVRPFCGDFCYYPPLLMSIIGWLGFFNSLLNPIIYTVFNPDFRKAFTKILFGRYRKQSGANFR